GIVDAGYNQQLGNISGSGQFLIGTTDSPATALVGFASTSLTVPSILNNNGGLSGVNSAAHFGKVGTGIIFQTIGNNSANLELSVRDGSLVIGGATGAVTNSSTTGSPISIYAGGQLRLGGNYNASAPFGPIAPLAFTGSGGQERISNTSPIRMAGGTLRLD